jgi:hypothetical protein
MAVQRLVHARQVLQDAGADAEHPDPLELYECISYLSDLLQSASGEELAQTMTGACQPSDKYIITLSSSESFPGIIEVTHL